MLSDRIINVGENSSELTHQHPQWVIVARPCAIITAQASNAWCLVEFYRMIAAARMVLFVGLLSFFFRVLAVEFERPIYHVCYRFSG
jgi:hypothetical protein